MDKGMEWWCDINSNDRRSDETMMSPEEYIDFHIRLEEKIREEGGFPSKVDGPSKDSDARDTLPLKGVDGGPD